MLRRKLGATAPIDATDRALLLGVDAGLRWSALIDSVRCGEEEATRRVLRLIEQGHLEGTPGEAKPQVPSRTFAPPARSSASELVPRGASTAARSSSSPPRLSSPPGKTVPPRASAAGEALLRELAARRSGTSYPPVGRSSLPAPPPQNSVRPGDYRVRPEEAGAHEPLSSRPASPNAPSGSSSQRESSAPQATSAHPAAAAPAHASSRPAAGAPPDRYSSTPQAPRPSQAPAPVRREPSQLVSLIAELSFGTEQEQWLSTRLREAIEREHLGQWKQALAIVQVVMAQMSDPRLLVERERLHARVLKAQSGVYRARALGDERAGKPFEAAESWAKVLEACPDDADAALRAASCCMEAGELKQAGSYARRAVELAPSSIAAHRLLYRFFRKTGMELNANRERDILKQLAKTRDVDGTLSRRFR